MKGNDIIKLVRESGIFTLNYCLKDMIYALPDGDQINNEFAREFAARLNEMGLRYDPEASDCDDFALEARNLFLRFWRKSGDRRRSVAFGELDFFRDADGILHEINFFVQKVGGVYQLCFWEPQTQSEINLSKKERESCERWLV